MSPQQTTGDITNMTNSITRVACVGGINRRGYVAGLSGGFPVRLHPWASPMGKNKFVAVRARKGHPTPPAYAMQCRQQFYPRGLSIPLKTDGR